VVTYPQVEYTSGSPPCRPVPLRHKITASSGRERVRGVGGAVAGRFGYTVRFCRSAPLTGGRRPSRWRYSPREAIQSPTSPRRADRSLRVRKSTFAARHFHTEVISWTLPRPRVFRHENDKAATADAFEVAGLHRRQAPRRGEDDRPDATSVRPEDRRPLVSLARASTTALPVAIVFEPAAGGLAWSATPRAGPGLRPHVVRQPATKSMRPVAQEPPREGSANTFGSTPPTRSTRRVERTASLERPRAGSTGPSTSSRRPTVLATSWRRC